MTPTQPVHPAGSGVRSGEMTRADVVALGRAGRPWEFVPVALRALGVEPRDEEVRFLLSAAYGGLGLRTCALEQIGMLSAEARGDAAAAALRAAVEQLPDDRVSLAERATVCGRNLDVLAGRAGDAVDLRGKLNAWKMLSGMEEWFRALPRGGAGCGARVIVRRKRGEAGEWAQWGDSLGAAERVRLSKEETVQKNALVPPVVMEGADPPWLLRRLYQLTMPRGDGYLPRIDVLQGSELEFLSGLAQHDLAAELGDARVRVHVGSEAAGRWTRELEGRAAAGVRVYGPVFVEPRTRARLNPSPAHVLVHVTAAQQALFERLDAQAKGAYAGRDRAWNARRFAEGMKRLSMPPGATNDSVVCALDEPTPSSSLGEGDKTALRVLVPTCRYTTFVQHSARDLAEALRRIGCDARLLIEPDAHSHITNLALVREVAEFRPDLVIQINYTRANLGTAYPPGAVFVTWIQDAMPHLFERRTGDAHTNLDFVTGNLRDDLFQFFGYPRGRAMHAPPAASARKFHDGEVSDAQRGRFTCEIAYVSHHGETPEKMRERMTAESSGGGAAMAWMGDVANDLFGRIGAAIDAPPTIRPLSGALRAMTAEALGKRGVRPDDHAVTQILNKYTQPMADRMLRHRTLEWAAAIARKRGWRLHIHGCGWEDHPTLAEFARGELEHGDDLRACYRCARAHLQVSAHTVLHQRVFECLLSGGLALCRLQADDLCTMQFAAAAQACGRGETGMREPDASEPWEILEQGQRRIGYRAEEHEAGRGYAAMLRELGLGEQEFLWINPVMADRLRRLGGVEAEEFMPARLFGDPAAVMFHTPERLETLLTRAVEDDAWRRETRERVLNHARPWITDEGFARRLLEFVSAKLNGPDRDGREWFDGRERPV